MPILCFAGGTLKIYGESLRPDVPYKTLLLSIADTALYVLKETLEKYGMEKEDPNNYCLVQVTNAQHVSEQLSTIIYKGNCCLLLFN